RGGLPPFAWCIPPPRSTQQLQDSAALSPRCSASEHRTPTDFLCTKLQPNIMPLNWRTTLPRPQVRTHLPIDALAYLTLPLLEGLSCAPLFPAHLPLIDVMTAAYRGLQ